MGNVLVATALTVVLASPLIAPKQTPPVPSGSAAQGMSYTGCLRATRAAPEHPDEQRVVYTLEVLPPASVQRTAEASGSGAATSAKPETIQLSAEAATRLSRYVGKRIQVTGELLQPPGLPPGAGDPDRPLPRSAEATFRVASVKLLGEKCPN